MLYNDVSIGASPLHTVLVLRLILRKKPAILVMAPFSYVTFVSLCMGIIFSPTADATLKGYFGSKQIQTTSRLVLLCARNYRVDTVEPSNNGCLGPINVTIENVGDTSTTRGYITCDYFIVLIVPLFTV